DIWLFDLVRGGNTRFTFDPSIDRAAVWSPDSRLIAFRSGRDGSGGLYVRPAAQTQPEHLLLTGQNDRIPFSWSPDGRFLMYSESAARRLTYLQVPSDGTPSSGPISFLENSFRNSHAQFSPDGKWVAYTSDASSRREIYVRPFPPPKDGGSQWMISNGGG